MLRTVAVIGLGRFGSRLAVNLTRLGREVIAIDRDRDIIEALRDRVTLAVAMDATDEQALRAQGVHRVDAAVVGIGTDFEATVLATVLLKQLGVPKVIARAASRTSAQVLERIGADRVVIPEDEAADRWAHRLVGPEVLNQIEFHEGHSIVEWKAPASWSGRSLAQLDVRAKFGLHVVAVRRDHDAGGILQAGRIEVLGPRDPLREGDVLILMGKDEDVAKLPQS